MRGMGWGHTVHVKLQLIPVNVGIQFYSGVEEVVPHMFEPFDIAFLEVSHAPYISALHEAEEMQAGQSLPVPIQIGQ